jgi:uncharacterized protein (DUF58 family)
MDWLAFARTGSPVLKVFRDEEDVVVRLVVDASASLDAGEPPKLLIAKRVAAAVGYLALAASERAQVLSVREGLVDIRSPRRGRGALAELLSELDAIVPAGGTNLARALGDVLLRAGRPGMLVVVSDFLDAGPVHEALAKAAATGHDLVLVQVLAPEEVEPPWEGDLALEDAETGAVCEMTIDARAVSAYLARLNALFAALRATAQKHRAAYVRITTADSLLEALRRILSRALD